MCVCVNIKGMFLYMLNVNTDRECEPHIQEPWFIHQLRVIDKLLCVMQGKLWVVTESNSLFGGALNVARMKCINIVKPCSI
jgi:hypothetical protein